MEVASYRIGGLIALKTLSDVASRLSSFLRLLLAARFFNPFEFGLFSLAWATGWIISIASDLGLQLFVARSPGQAGQFVPTLFRLRLYLASVLFGSLASPTGCSGGTKEGPSFWAWFWFSCSLPSLNSSTTCSEGLGEAISNHGPICFTGWAPCLQADACSPPVSSCAF